uniref:Nitroreductase n=1 Tax=candidate division WOR-3 bacterium TaxID=2052148 RepID=A0A7C6A8J2_UNCW3
MEFYDVIQKRKSVRAYKQDPIPDQVLNRILEAVRNAPSAKNLQPWKFIIVKDPQTIEELVPACNNQQFIAQAPIVICAVGLESEAWGRMGGYWRSLEVDVAIAFEHLVLAAANEGLGTCWIGAYKEAEVKKVLKIPDGVKVIALTPLGYPVQEPPARPRKPLNDIISYDRF